MIEIDAGQQLTAETFRDIVVKATTDKNAPELFWRTPPDVAFNVARLGKTDSLSASLCGIPLQIEWDAKPNEITLRDKYTALGRVFNLP